MKSLFYGLKPMESRVLYGKRDIMGCEVYLEGMRLFNGELLIIATNEFPGKAIQQYAIRWEIESLFSCFKGRGFNFEETHIIDYERIKKLIVLLAIAFCWAHKTGEWRHEHRPIKIKTHGRAEVSIFRYGLDYLIEAILNLGYRCNLFKICLKIIRGDWPNNLATGSPI